MAKRDLNLEDILKEYDPNAPKEPEQAAPDAAPKPEQTGTPLTQPVTRPITPQTRKRRQATRSLRTALAARAASTRRPAGTWTAVGIAAATRSESRETSTCTARREVSSHD